MRDIDRILIPVDFSDCSRAAALRGLELAEQFDSQVEVIHFYELPDYVDAEILVFDGPDEQPLKDLAHKRAVKALDIFLKELPGGDSDRVTSKVAEGRPADGILQEASAQEDDFIVMGTHGRTGLSHLLLGSVAEKVIRQAEAPVMTVRLPEAA